MAMSVSDLERKLENLSIDGDYKFTYWDKKVYNHKYVSHADALLVVLPDNAWSIGTEIPRGMRREIVEAVSLKKDIYLLYTLMSGINNVYKTLVTHKIEFHISGVRGFVNKIEPSKKRTNSAVNNHSVKVEQGQVGYDNRILLLLG